MPPGPARLVRFLVSKSEFLVHAADVEGLCQGIDEDLVKCKPHPVTLSYQYPTFILRTGLGEWATIPIVYAGGAKG